MAGFLQPFETEDQYLRRVFAHPLFGHAPSRATRLVSELTTTDPDECLITAIRVQHGRHESGYLILTTHFLRYVKAGRLITLLHQDEFWTYGWLLEFETITPWWALLRTPTGHQFQTWRGRAKRFREIHELAQLSGSGESSEQTDMSAIQPLQIQAAGDDSLTGELERLANLRVRGVISDAEFEAAKGRLLP